MSLSGPKKVMALYNPASNAPLFQIKTASGWQVLTDARVRKNLAKINQCMHLPSNFYTFHAFRHSGAFLPYELGIPVKEIKEHGHLTALGDIFVHLRQLVIKSHTLLGKCFVISPDVCYSYWHWGLWHFIM